jgi:hypothetical protein
VAGLDGAEFAWGDEFTPGGKHMASTCQGRHKFKNRPSPYFRHRVRGGMAGCGPIRKHRPPAVESADRGEPDPPRKGSARRTYLLTTLAMNPCEPFWLRYEQHGPVAASECSGVQEPAQRPVMGLCEREGPPLRPG